MTVTKVSCTSFLTGTRVRTLELLSVCVHIAHASVLYRVSQNYTKQHFNALMCLVASQGKQLIRAVLQKQSAASFRSVMASKTS